MKKILWFMAAGGFAGGLLSSWLAPKLIAWYFNPPVEMAINCKSPIEWALAKLQIAQAAGSVGGALVFAVLYFTFFRKNPEKLIPPN